MAPPDSSFHFQTASRNFSRPIATRLCCRSASWRSTTSWVAMPAWSVPGCHSTSLPRMRSKRASMSCSVLLRAWPICRRPVTLGGGMTMQNGSASGLAARTEGARCLPLGVDAPFHVLGIESLVEHGTAKAPLGRHGPRLVKQPGDASSSPKKNPPASNCWRALNGKLFFA